MKVIKITIGEWENASRDLRELSVISEFENVNIKVFAKGSKTGEIDNVGGYEVTRLTTRPLGEKVPNSINRIISIFSWAHILRKENANIISGHDIIALLIAYLSNLCKRKNNKAKLVYDSHEFELGRNVNRSKLQKKIIYHLEKFLIKKSEFMIVVNDIIADRVKEIYKLSERPIVARNIPEYWELEEEEIRNTRKKLLKELKVDDAFVLMYHGAVAKDRGIEVLLDVVNMKKDIMCIFLGNGEEKYLSLLKEVSKQLGIENRVLFKEAVNLKDLYKYVGAANVGMITIPGKYESYYYMLPNKFFENIQSLTPVIVSDFPEIGKMVDEYNIGIKVNPESMDDIINAINIIKEDELLYSTFKKNLVNAKKELCWENEKKILKNVYADIIKECSR